MKVLEIGTGSGYQAAVLSKLCRRLYSIERHKDLLAAAEDKFRMLRMNNITAKVGDGTRVGLNKLHSNASSSLQQQLVRCRNPF